MGAGYYVGALVTTLFIYLTLNTFKRFVARGNPSKNIYIEAENMSRQAAEIGAIVKRYGGNLHTLEVLYADSSPTKRKSKALLQMLPKVQTCWLGYRLPVHLLLK